MAGDERQGGLAGRREDGQVGRRHDARVPDDVLVATRRRRHHDLVADADAADGPEVRVPVTCDGRVAALPRQRRVGQMAHRAAQCLVVVSRSGNRRQPQPRHLQRPDHRSCGQRRPWSGPARHRSAPRSGRRGPGPRGPPLQEVFVEGAEAGRPVPSHRDVPGGIPPETDQRHDDQRRLGRAQPPCHRLASHGSPPPAAAT
jgi:hypothetical protein